MALHGLHPGPKCHMSRICSCCCIFVQFSLLHSIPLCAYTAVFLSILLERNSKVASVLGSQSPMLMNVLTAPYWTHMRVSAAGSVFGVKYRPFLWSNHTLVCGGRCALGNPSQELGPKLSKLLWPIHQNAGHGEVLSLTHSALIPRGS